MKLIPGMSFELFLLLLLFGMAGCAPKYIPSVIHAPMLNNKGEIQASVSGGTSSFSPQIAYAVTDNIGIMLNGSFANRDSTEDDDLFKVRYGEFGVGYYRSIANRGVFDVYAGYGFGTMNSSFSNWSVEAWNTHSDFMNNRLFVQPSIGYLNKVIDVSFATNLSMTIINKNEIVKNSYFITPVVTLKVGYKYVKCIFQAGASIKTREFAEFDYNPLVTNMGLQVDLFRKYE